jgi:TonB family protein
MASKKLDAAPQFGLLEVSREERRRWWASFGVSWLIQIPMVFVALWFVGTSPKLQETASTKSVAVTLLTPPPPATAPRQRTVLNLPAPSPSRRIVEQTTPTPKPILPREAHVIPPKPSRETVTLPSAPPPVPATTAQFQPALPKWKPQTHVGGFEGGRAVATVKLPHRAVQTGGFGNPHGISGETRSEGNVAHLGSFDHPEGAGSGNGTGGAKGARGLVASAGFGNGVAAAGVQRNAGRDVASAGFGNGIADGPNGADASGAGQTRSAGFTNAQSMTRALTRPTSRPQVAAFMPVEITSKPDPLYTDEARRLHIQGEVILRVDFTASGQVRVLDVEQRLGHGLDLAAARAAQQIQFKPARRDGRPVDTNATLHILFKLAD